jgi:putative aldouronate transport system substrate-binding protein
MKRTGVVLMSIILILCFMTACSRRSGGTSAAGTVARGSSEIYNENFSKNMDLSWFGGSNAPLEDNSWGELEIEKLFNVNLKIIRADTIETQAAMFASGNIPDLIIALDNSISGVAAMNAQGIIGEIPIDKIETLMPTLYNDGIGMDPKVFTYNIIEGKNMAIPRFYYTASTRSPVIRADWLKAVNMPIPKTLEEYEETLVAFREKDPDGDGVKNTYGMTGFINNSEYQRMFASVFGAFGVNPFYWRLSDTGDVEFGFTTDDFVQGLKTLNRWYERGIIDPEFITQDYRTSGEDIAFKFANGRIGLMEGYSFDDYQIDNDGHVSAKWTAVYDSWKKFFDDNADNADVMYQYDVPTDFVTDLIEPYYIAIDPPVGPKGKSGSVKDAVIATRICVGKQVEKDPEKLERIMRILEVMVTDPDINVYHLGPESHGQWMFAEDGTRVMNPRLRESPTYHPQGVKDGTSWFLWPMWFCNKMSMEVIGGAKNIQRYVRTFPIFQNKPNIPNVVQGALPSIGEYSELTVAYVRDYIAEAVRGDVKIDASYPRMRENWFRLGGDQLTKEANEWYKSVQ